MKRVGYLYDKICDIDNLRKAHKEARANKGWYEEVKMVDEDVDKYLYQLQDMLKNKTYKTSNYTVIRRKEGRKMRTIYKLPYFPDRICHWAILLVISDYIIKSLTVNTYSSLPKRGIHFGLKRLQDDINNDVINCQYCLKMDVTKYYESINHEILKSKYRKLFKDNDLLWLLDEIIDSISTGKELGVGIPIGNYLSQFSANLYLNDFDHWMKEELKLSNVHRYMDDIVILHESKSFLHSTRIKINEYLEKELKLKMKANYQVFPTYIRGVDFLGYRSFGNYTLLRKTTCQTMKNKIDEINEYINILGKMTYSDYCSYNSYNGWLKYCDNYRLSNKYIKPMQTHSDNYYNTYIKPQKES